MLPEAARGRHPHPPIPHVLRCINASSFLHQSVKKTQALAPSNFVKYSVPILEPIKLRFPFLGARLSQTAGTVHRRACSTDRYANP